jgi:hypothetical protein
MYGLSLITAPAQEPVTLERAKAYLRVDHNADDDLIQGLITAARQLTEKHANRCWVEQQWRMTLLDWPDGGGGSWVESYLARATGLEAAGIAGAIPLPFEPVLSLDALKYYASSGTLTTLVADTNYQVWLDHSPPLVMPAPLSVWPTVQVGKVPAVIVEFTAGYGDASAVPEQAKSAILLCLGYWYENRGDGMDLTMMNGLPQALGMPPGAMRLLNLMNTDGYR